MKLIFYTYKNIDSWKNNSILKGKNSLMDDTAVDKDEHVPPEGTPAWH